MEIFYKPWPWYVAGPAIGLTVPLLLLFDNKKLGISSTLRQICAVCYPGKLPFLNYDWKKEQWNLYFVFGLIIGGFIGGKLLANPHEISLSAQTINYLQSNAIEEQTGLLPRQLFNWNSLLTLKGFIIIVLGGFLVGFGTRYARGCTSGHGIMGLSSLQWPSLLAVISFFVGGIFFHHFILPYILNL